MRKILSNSPRRGPGKSSSVTDRSDWLRHASQKPFSDMPRLFADARILGYLVESLSRFAESKLQRNFPLLSAQRQMQDAARFLRIHPTFRTTWRIGSVPRNEDVPGVQTCLSGCSFRIDTVHRQAVSIPLGIKSKRTALVFYIFQLQARQWQTFGVGQRVRV